MDKFSSLPKDSQDNNDTEATANPSTGDAIPDKPTVPENTNNPNNDLPSDPQKDSTAGQTPLPADPTNQQSLPPTPSPEGPPVTQPEPPTTVPTPTPSEPIDTDANHCSGVVDQCPVTGGITWHCKKRFLHGINYAWHNFGGDFGGIAPWGQKGIAATPAIDTELADMKANGAHVIRWWMMPDFRGDGVVFDANDKPIGLGPTFLNDLNGALALAEKHDLYLMLTIFSFDNFKPTTTSGGIKIRGLNPLIMDPTKRAALLQNVIRPMARAVQASPLKKRLITWEVINEPEWAIVGSSKYGDPNFDCNTSLQCVSHDQMESFLGDVIGVLKAESKALISVGGAAIKWKNAWSKLKLDYYQFHTYDWVDQYYPYSRSPAQYGVTDKPVVMGEYPLNGLPNIPVPNMLNSYITNGYGGALGWSVTDAAFNWAGNKINIKKFADKYPCETHF